MAVVGVKFTDNGKKYLFDDNNLNLKENITVIVETDKGLQFGKVVSIEEDSNRNDLKKIIRKSNKRDYLQHLNNLKDTKYAIEKCRELALKEGLKMTILDATYTFDRSQLIFRFIADERIDFRQLAKELGATFKTRIELRQVGIRDKAKEVGGFGPCGRKMCCCSFLNEFDSVSINMAKNQNLALNPQKINGTCGRLLCCLKYEDENYTEYKKGLPELGKRIKTKDVEGSVVAVDIFEKSYKVLTDDNGIVEIKLDKEEENNGSKE